MSSDNAGTLRGRSKQLDRESDLDSRRRSEIVFQRGGRERRIQLGPFASLLVTVLAVALAVALIAFGVVFGSLVLGVALAVVLVVLVIAFARNAWMRFWR